MNIEKAIADVFNRLNRPLTHRDTALRAIASERAQQDILHPHAEAMVTGIHPDTADHMAVCYRRANEYGETWWGVLNEELAEAFAEDRTTPAGRAAQNDELVQLAALCVRMIEHNLSTDA